MVVATVFDGLCLTILSIDLSNLAFLLYSVLNSSFPFPFLFVFSFLLVLAFSFFGCMFRRASKCQSWGIPQMGEQHQWWTVHHVRNGHTWPEKMTVFTFLPVILRSWGILELTRLFFTAKWTNNSWLASVNGLQDDNTGWKERDGFVRSGYACWTAICSLGQTARLWGKPVEFNGRFLRWTSWCVEVIALRFKCVPPNEFQYLLTGRMSTFTRFHRVSVCKHMFQFFHIG